MNMAHEIKQQELAQAEQQVQDTPKGVLGFAFGNTQQSKGGLTFCGGPPVPTTQMGLLNTSISRHPETGQPIQSQPFGFGLSTNNITNNRCFPVPQNMDDKQDKKKILDKLYSELHMLRCEIDKLNKSVDNIYDIMRHL